MKMNVVDKLSEQQNGAYEQNREAYFCSCCMICFLFLFRFRTVVHAFVCVSHSPDTSGVFPRSDRCLYFV
jgi:hypothetical protein